MRILNSTAVLYIDNRPFVLEHRKAILESCGYYVTLASNESAAMKVLENTLVDAVLLEYKLEGTDTEDIAFHIKQRFPHLPLILLSAYPEIPERILWLVDDYVMKSDLPEGLRYSIERVVATRLHAVG